MHAKISTRVYWPGAKLENNDLRRLAKSKNF